jgi:hypothetical protein
MTQTADQLDSKETAAGGAAEGTPRWVKMFRLVGALLVLAFVLAKATGAGGDHGPGMHTGGGDDPARAIDGEDHQPVDSTPSAGHLTCC